MSSEVAIFGLAFLSGFMLGNLSKLEMRALLAKWIKRHGKK
jgi:hypothetical protein